MRHRFWGSTFSISRGGIGELYLPEIMGSGCALLDFDQDGDLDLYFVQGGLWFVKKPHRRPGCHGIGSTAMNCSRVAPRRCGSPMSRKRRGSLVRAYGMGAAVGDYDGDGQPDLYVTNLGGNQLWRNVGDGRFEDVTAAAGVDDQRWSTAATWFDYDRDGQLDLFVANYVDFDPATSPDCYATNSARDYCGPDAYPAVSDSLFHNLGNGRFENVSATAMLDMPAAAGLG
ncbi:MAG: VCBS repeat-containing protein [Planctomycetaceae bacterium]